MFTRTKSAADRRTASANRIAAEAMDALAGALFASDNPDGAMLTIRAALSDAALRGMTEMEKHA